MFSHAPCVTVDEVKRMLRRGVPVTFIDSRNSIAWASSKATLPGAIRVPVDEVDRYLHVLPDNHQLVVYCT